MRFYRNIIQCIPDYKIFIIRDILLKTLDFFFFNEFFRLLNRKKYIILWYHGVSHRFISFSTRHIAKSEFEKQIKYLKRKGYSFFTLTELIKTIYSKKKIKSKTVIFSFDDGFKNIIKNAYPLMKKYNLKGCFYVISDLIDSNQLLWTDYIELTILNYKNSTLNFKFKDKNIEYPLFSNKMIKYCINDIKERLKSLGNDERIQHLKQFQIPNKLSSFSNIPEEYILAESKEIASLDRTILEIGSHTKSHPNLPSLKKKEEFEKELYEAKIEIENYVGYKINHLCYPAGAFNDITIRFAKKYEYLTGVTTISGLNTSNTDLFKLKRLLSDNNFIKFKAKISGLYSFMKRIIKL